VSSLILCNVWDTGSNNEANEDLLVSGNWNTEPSDGVNEDLLVSGEKFILSYKMKFSKNIKQNNLKSNK